jgi:glycosyltransferase involved in cell wall biosynthesis
VRRAQWAPVAPAPASDDQPMTVAYTLEQCWHDPPGGTAVAALEIARQLEGRDDVEIRYVAGKHARIPIAEYRPPGPVAMLPLARPWLYETWTRVNWPKVESVTGPVDVVHATGLVPSATSSPLVVTVHDVAFVHDPDKFSRHGAGLMRRSLAVIRRRADLVICPSRSTVADLVDLGVDRSRLRLVPLGVHPSSVAAGERRRVLRAHRLPDEFVLFVGTLEPRKNLVRLATAHAARGGPEPLVVVGAEGWGDLGELAGRARADTRFLGFVPADDLVALYAAATVFAYPSEREGFGLPVAEAMAAGTPVVTSRGTSTEEVAGGAAVLVDPFDVDDIVRGLEEAFDRRAELSVAGAARAAELSWSNAAQRTVEVYRELLA